MTMPIVRLSRRYAFAASHRLYTDGLPQEENEAIFGKCANPNGHGHNYGLTVTVAGPIDPATGYLMPLDELDGMVRRHVLDAYDHRHLNMDVEDYLSLVPSGENIVRCVWRRLEGPLAGKLRHITLDETRNNRFEYPISGRST
ncbi:MAG: 6-carboxytetrahydropterin synthase [Dehalococcoidia bacterium]